MKHSQTIHSLIFSLMLLIGSGVISPVTGQNRAVPEPVGSDSFPPGEQLIVKNSDNFIAERVDDENRKYLRGNVRLVQDSTYMFCDTARLVDNTLTATGSVVIIQGDSVQVFSDSLFYDGDEKFAHLHFGVVLRNADKELFTESLDYDLNTRIAVFRDTALLRKGSMQLSSIYGQYNMNTRQAYFEKEVVIIDDDFKLNTDSLSYDLNADLAYFLGPTYIIQGSKKIYCEDGYYDTVEGRAHFSGNAVLQDEDTQAVAQDIYYSSEDSLLVLRGDAEISDSSGTAKGDQIRIDDRTGDIRILGQGSYESEEKFIQGPDILYNQKTEDIYLAGRSTVIQESRFLEADTIRYTGVNDYGTALGNVIWRDTLEKRALFTDVIEFNDSSGFYKAVSHKLRPIFMDEAEEDTFYVVADTLIRGREMDSIDYLIAQGSVRMLQKDFRGLGDSLHYSSIDSIFTLFDKPVCWADTTQITGDTIRLFIREGTLSQISSMGKAFLVDRVSPSYYNQISSNRIDAFIKGGSLERMDARGNARSIYMVQDEEDAFVGPNKTLCRSIHFYFTADSLERISFVGTSDSQLTPMKDAGSADLFLELFTWRENERPEDIASMRALVFSRRTDPGHAVEDESDEFGKAVRELLPRENEKQDIESPPVSKEQPATKGR